MKNFFYLLAALSVTATGFAQDFEDDIYYDGRKAEKQQKSERTVQSQTIFATADNPSGYAAGWQPSIELDRDVDEYNRFGSYFAPIDTIGSAMADSEDFVYTQQIQKYYNPTIVVDNADVLADVLENSYGNVNIVYGVTGPAFSSWFDVPYYMAYTPWSGFYSPANWGWYSGWLDPWYGLGPSWGFGWGWGWSAPGWGWGWNRPGWGNGCIDWFDRGWFAARPSVGPRPGWSLGRPNSAGNTSIAPRPGKPNRYGHRELGATANHRPGTVTNGRRPFSGNVTNGRQPRPGSTQTIKPANRPDGRTPQISNHSVRRDDVKYGNLLKRGSEWQQAVKTTGTLGSGSRPATTQNARPATSAPGTITRGGNSSYRGSTGAANSTYRYNSGSSSRPSTSYGTRSSYSSGSSSSYRSSGASSSSSSSSAGRSSGSSSRGGGGGRASGGRR